MQIVILGCGRVGAALASMLSREGHTVTIVDLNDEAFGRLSPTFPQGQTVLGDGTDEDVLRRAGIEEADAFVAVTEGDNRNIMASQVAREIFGVKEVITRIYDPVREEIYRDLGLDTICPTMVVSEMIHTDLVARLERSRG